MKGECAKRQQMRSPPFYDLGEAGLLRHVERGCRSKHKQIKPLPRGGLLAGPHVRRRNFSMQGYMFHSAQLFVTRPKGTSALPCIS